MKKFKELIKEEKYPELMKLLSFMIRIDEMMRLLSFMIRIPGSQPYFISDCMKYKKELKNTFKDVDLIEAVHKARKRSTLLLKEQSN